MRSEGRNSRVRILCIGLGFLLLLGAWSQFNQLFGTESTMSQSPTKLYKLVDFEVFGKVQGVFFRKYTKKTCDKHHVTGWVINTQHGTVQGTLEGSSQNVSSVKRWLSTQGSPSSRIDKAEFFNERQSEKRTFDSFKVIRNPSEVAAKTFRR